MPLVEQLPGDWQLVAEKEKNKGKAYRGTVFIKPGTLDGQKLVKITGANVWKITRKDFGWIVDA